MRIVAALAASAVTAGGAVFALSGPVMAAVCLQPFEWGDTRYGSVRLEVSTNCGSTQLEFAAWSAVPIKAESWVRVLYRDGTASPKLKFTDNNGGGGSGPNFVWRYWNPIDRPNARRVEFHLQVGPDGAVDYVDRSINF